jgi:hypothetical protein
MTTDVKGTVTASRRPPGRKPECSMGRDGRDPLSGLHLDKAGNSKTRPARSLWRAAGRIMCEAQRIDFEAAREGKITWTAYFHMWGDCGP